MTDLVSMQLTADGTCTRCNKPPAEHGYGTRNTCPARDLSGLSPQLTGLERARVEVVTDDDTTRRFYVGRSTGWRPCHVEVALRTSTGGPGAEKHYKSVRVIRYNAR